MYNDDYYLNELNAISNVNSDNISSYCENDYNDKCLISIESLEENYIQLDCGHKFNYIYIFEYLSLTNKFHLQCPYCLKNTFKTLPIRKIDGTYYYDNRLNIPLANCLTREHKCLICQEACFIDVCIKHHKYFKNIYDDSIDNYIKRRNNQFEFNVLYMMDKQKVFDLNEIIDNVLLDILSVSILKKICKSLDINGFIRCSKYELISLIKSVYSQ